MASTAVKAISLHKAIAANGSWSRRIAGALIVKGDVTLNGKVCRRPEIRVVPTDEIRVKNQVIETSAPPARMWKYHKPPGLITTRHDPQGRPTIFDALPLDLPRVVSVGRLDVYSEGLMLLTTSGQLARQLELPSSAFIRRYNVLVTGSRHITSDIVMTLDRGLELPDGLKLKPITAQVSPPHATGRRWVAMSLREGKKREIRRCWEYFGFGVSRLIRVGYGPFDLDHLPPGQFEKVADVQGTIRASRSSK